MDDIAFETALQQLISSGHVNTLIRILNDPQVRVDAGKLLGSSEYQTVINTAQYTGQEEYIKRIMFFLNKSME